MGDKDDYLTSYRVFFENFAATVNPVDQLPVNIAGYTITEAELPGEVLYWITQYLSEKQCPQTLLTPLRRIILEEVRIASKKQPNEFGYKSDEAVFIALRLMQAVTARVNDVCLRYLDNSRLDSLPPPTPSSLRELKTVSAAAKNSRRVMEDRHVEIGNLEALFGRETTEPTSFYAVYDGHAGSAAATYCAAHLHQYLVESAHFTTDLRAALREAYIRTDTEFVRKSNQERARGGSTAVSIAVRGRRLHAAWAGDSLALLAKRMRLMQLVRPHKPDRQDERDRIESSGGTVMFWGTWRVNGQLAVSRAIGDAQYKPYVTARPELATVELDGDEDFVVVACDGLWDFVSEDDVALSVYRQLAADPDDLKAVTRRLIVQAKLQGSCDNISIIVVFLKEPRDIAVENRPPMDLGLDNALANAPPPFASETDACKRQETTPAHEANGPRADAAADNGVDNSDSDSEDFGPETAVDIDEAEHDSQNNQIAPPTPPVHTVEEAHVDGALVDNVGESGEESEDEWNYYKGEGEREPELDNQPSDTPDEPPLSDTPCQDNSAWESSSVDMNSSPLNPDAPVFVPGGVSGPDVLLAESPRKPLPMDDIELPDSAQFNTGAVVRPAELLDLDNCDQLNGHHNVSLAEKNSEHLNGNDTHHLESLGFGFNVGIEPNKINDTCLIQDFERIQKETTDFCNIQVFQTHCETNPFSAEDNDELLERLKNKERDPMSMSFYQEKDDDTCEKSDINQPIVDLNAVQPLPDSDDEELQTNGICDNESDKENVNPDHSRLVILGGEPNNDVILEERNDILSQNMQEFGQGDNFTQYTNTNVNVQNYSNIDFDSCRIPQENIVQTDTPESHKLLFEQIPEIPDGKSSELGFTNEDFQDPSESDKDLCGVTPQDETSHYNEMESNHEVSPSDDLQPMEDIISIETENLINTTQNASQQSQDLHFSDKDNLDLDKEDNKLLYSETTEPSHDLQQNITVQVHTSDVGDSFPADVEALQSHKNELQENTTETLIPEITIELTQSAVQDFACEELLPAESPSPTHNEMDTDSAHSPVPVEVPLPTQSPLPSESHTPIELQLSPGHEELHTVSPIPAEVPLGDSPALSEERLEMVSPTRAESQLSSEINIVESSTCPAYTEQQTNIDAPIENFDTLELQSESSPGEQLQTTLLEPVDATGEEQEVISKLEVKISREATPDVLHDSIPDAPRDSTPEVPHTSPLEDLQEATPGELREPTPEVLREPTPEILREPSPEVLREPTPEVLQETTPEVLPEPTPQVLLEPTPEVLREPTPEVLREPSPEVLQEPTPEVLREPTPEELREPTPEVLQEPTPEVLREPTPEVLLEPTTEVVQKSTPEVVRESTPEILREPTPEISTEPTPEIPREPTPEIPREPTPEIPRQPTPTAPCDFAAIHLVTSPEIHHQTPEPNVGPAPDIVPDDHIPHLHSEPVTDIDIGITESRAQEICMPVTNEIRHEEVEQSSSTPPPTPAIESTQDDLSVDVDIPTLNETPIAAPVEPIDDSVVPSGAAIAAVAAATAVAATAAVATAKSKSLEKKSPTTKTPVTKTTAKSTSTAKTSTSATKSLATKPAPKTATPSKGTTPITKPSTPSAAKAATPARTSLPKSGVTKAPIPKLTKVSSNVSKELTAPTSRPTTAPASKTTAKPTATKQGVSRPATAAAAPASRTMAAARPAAAPRAALTSRAAAPAPRAAPAARTTAPKTDKPTADKKPLPNGDVKPTAAARAVPARPAPASRSVATRPAPRAATAAAPAKTTSTNAKPASRPTALSSTRPTLDKQSKDLANKRITAKAAPPRTAPAKAPTKAGTTTKTAVKKVDTSLTNGSVPSKPAPTPPPVDNALLPDVIA